MIEAELLAHLKDNVSLVSSRVFPNQMEQNTVKPAMVYRVAFESDDVSLSGEACLESGSLMEWEVFIFSNEYLENKTVKNEVKQALYSFGHGIHDVVMVGDGYDEESELYVQELNFKTKG